jgi:hypothetical protein
MGEFQISFQENARNKSAYQNSIEFTNAGSNAKIRRKPDDKRWRNWLPLSFIQNETQKSKGRPGP